MNKVAEIWIAKDFSRHPGPRFKRQGKDSGEAFREFLIRAFSKSQKLIVHLDGTTGMGSSFIGEAFGGLVRLGYFKKDELLKRLEIRCDEDITYQADAYAAIDEAVLDNDAMAPR